MSSLYYDHQKAFHHIAFFCAALGFFIACLFPIKFQSNASFKYEGQKDENTLSPETILKSLTEMGSAQDLKPYFHSRTILRPVVEKLGLQIIAYEKNLFARLFQRAFENCKAEIRLYLPREESFRFSNVKCDEELTRYFYIKFSDATHYELFDGEKKPLGSSSSLSFKVESIPKKLVPGKFYRLKVIPRWKAIEKLKKALKVKSYKSKNKIFYLFYSHRDRKIADAVLANVMEGFQAYLKRENEEIAKIQLAYLEKRQNELLSKLDASFSDYVGYLKSNWGKKGFVGTDLELNSLFGTKQNYQNRLLDFDLELKRFARANNSPALNTTFHEIDPAAAKQLYLAYNEQLDQVMLGIKQLSFIAEQMHLPTFELSSLKSFLPDSATGEVMQKISELSYQLRDEHNWSEREKERIKEQLKVQKEQLLSNIHQHIELEKIKANLIEEKIALLQSSALALLTNEKKLIEEKLGDLSSDLSDLPEKWHLEQQLKFKTALAQGVMQAVSQVAEGKTIEHQLKSNNSKPIDTPFCKVRPTYPMLLIKSLLFALFGTTIFSFYLALKRIVKIPRL
jgi:hypothetical protein